MTTDEQRRRDLRQRAERFLEENPLFRKRYSSDDIHDLVEEIHIFQAELEVQNEELRHAQHQLIESRDRYYDLYDFAPVGYCSIDLNGHIVEINLAAAELLGKPRASLLNHSFVRFVARDDRQRVIATYGRAMRDSDRHECQVAIPIDSGDYSDTPRTVRIGVTARRKNGEGLLGFRVCMTDISELAEQQQQLAQLNRELEHRVHDRTAELERKNAQLKEVTGELLRAEQNERHRLAAALHDHLAQLLVVAAMRAEAADTITENGRIKEAFDDIKKLLHDAKQFTRTLITDLSPSVLFEKGLAAAMRHLARSMEEHGLRVEIVENYNPQLGLEPAILLYQSVRELLFNVLKHAGVDKATVTLDSRDGSLCVLVADEGKGFDEEAVRADDNDKAKFGLLSIRQRMDAIYGACTIDSEPGKGARVELCLPIGAEAAGEPASERIPTPAAEQIGERVSVLVVDDHQAVREGLKHLLQEQPALEIVGEAVDGIEAIDLARQLHPKAILMDINMPRMNGIDATRAITSEFPDTTIIGFSIREDEDARQAMADAGAKAFFTKGAPVREVCEVLLTHCV